MKKIISCIVYLILAILQCYTIAGLSTYYCKPNNENVRITGVDSGYIYTKLNNTNFYTDNLECQWTIDAGSDSKAVRLKILTTDLQFTPDYSICATYDYVQVVITDRYSGDQDDAVTFCGDRNPDAVISNSRHMKIIFQSNKVNFFDEAGVKMYFTTFDWSSGCPPGWSEPFPDSEYCYIAKNKPQVDWELAQYHCNYEGSNLAMIKTLDEYNFIEGLVNNSISKAWIGLNDMVAEDEVRWLDETSISNDLVKFVEETSDDEGYDCYIKDFSTGNFVESGCTNEKHGFICKKEKGKKTEIYDIPMAGRRKKEGDAVVPLLIATVCVILGLLIILIIVGVYKFYIRKRHKFSSHRNRHHESNPDTSSNNEPAAFEMAQPPQPPPPPYQEKQLEPPLPTPFF